MSDDARANLDYLESEGVKVSSLFDDAQWPLVEAAFSEAHLVVDALLGTGMSGAVRGLAVEAIRRLNAAREGERGAWVLAVDSPSGLDGNTGEPLGCCVRADVTVTFAAPKAGFSKGRGPEHCGKVVLADIGLPREIYRRRDAPRPSAGREEAQP